MWYREVTGGVEISVKVIAGAKKNEIAGVRGPSASSLQRCSGTPFWTGDFLVVKVTAQREKGRANEALITLFSKTYRCRKKDIRILKGEAQSKKLVFLPVPIGRLI